ncbi:mitochondrial enolase superfamily member 1-like [Ctenocephalides felis]|uniref:LOW QUALITY PROTEIN: mitochondrial enolase superfamily member 1-like n=1 Tax=Ctenocephalides felis TaxID=7515 RepID=UPI000E6E2C01|nr:LOW QUALITY PROTEIN: mitochondrial enolase superfamily member 1-like [Ctenocephalides felis]XP_026473874.1 mitochondrial enolase superfamily member 1-like [Ctenocephalides felis]
MNLKIISFDVKDIRFPTSLRQDGSDAMHADPDYSCAYVTLTTLSGLVGNGLTFTLGRGTDLVVHAIQLMRYQVIEKDARDIFNNFSSFWREITSSSQMRWIGPEKGVVHLAVAAIINALWDLWAKCEEKPLWKLLSEMDPEKLVSVIDFRYISDVITPQEAIEMLKSMEAGKEKRTEELLVKGYPAYTTQIGWLGYSELHFRELCHKYLDQGFTAFKLKVGSNMDDDINRCRIIREIIGWKNQLMLDANQMWDVNEAIKWMENLSEFKPLWIEEPTSPDDVLGHANISSALRPLGIAVATGEMIANRVMFKQFMQANAMEFCQIDSARIGGVNEILSVYLMAKKFNIKVCPHAGGVGLCEMVQHLQMWDYVSLSGTMDGRMIEYVDQQHEQFMNPVVVLNAKYIAPSMPGYNTDLKEDAIEMYEYPNGSQWVQMFKAGIFPKPT